MQVLFYFTYLRSRPCRQRQRFGLSAVPSSWTSCSSWTEVLTWFGLDLSYIITKKSLQKKERRNKSCADYACCRARTTSSGMVQLHVVIVVARSPCVGLRCGWFIRRKIDWVSALLLINSCKMNVIRMRMILMEFLMPINVSLTTF